MAQAHCDFLLCIPLVLETLFKGSFTFICISFAYLCMECNWRMLRLVTQNWKRPNSFSCNTRRTVEAHNALHYQKFCSGEAVLWQLPTVLRCSLFAAVAGIQMQRLARQLPTSRRTLAETGRLFATLDALPYKAYSNIQDTTAAKVSAQSSSSSSC